jgi:hypothetical protein
MFVSQLPDMKKINLLLFFSCAYFLSFAQLKNDRLSIFLDCTEAWLCDFDFVRSELKSVDFVRDRFVADVHVLVNTQRSSSGGTQAQVNFIGLKKYQSVNDTLTYFNDPTATEDEQRKKLLQYLKLGLVPFLAKTSLGDKVQISFGEANADTTVATTKPDPWNYWVFQFSANGGLNGSQNYKTHNFYGSFSADRETEDWKINYYFSANKDVQTFIDDEKNESKFTRKEYYSELQVARSINQHWSYGLSSFYANSLFSNVKTGLKLRPKLEFSLYPYSKFNNQRVVAQYMIGPVFNNYYDTTIYFKKKEWLLQHNLNIITSFTKPWGSINVGFFYSNYFDDLSKNNIGFNGAVSWKIVKGLNFALWGNYSLVHDQIALRKGQATRDELLVKNRELKSSFQYNMGIGFSYRFGSVLNSIVNPRFRGLSYSINF